MLRLTEIKIQNFRCFNDGITLQVQGNYNVLIGPNNAGKSAIFETLKKINKIILEETTPSLQSRTQKFDESDYSFQKASIITVSLTIEFDESTLRSMKATFRRSIKLETTPTKSNPRKIPVIKNVKCLNFLSEILFQHKITLLIEQPKQTYPKLCFCGNGVFFNSNGDFAFTKNGMELSQTDSIEEFEKIFSEQVDMHRLFDANGKIIDDILFRQKVEEKKFTLSKDAVKRVMQKFNIYFRNWKFLNEIRVRPSKENPTLSNIYDGTGVINELFNLANGTVSEKSIWRSIQEQFSELFPNHRIEVYQDRGGGKRDLRIYFPTLPSKKTEKKSLFEISLDQAGTGILEWIIFLIILTRERKSIILLEEPETHLHPTAQIVLNQLLRGSVERGNQLYVTTHSPCFIDLRHFDAIRAIRNDGQSSHVYQVRLDALMEDLKVRHNIDTDPQRLKTEYFNAFQYTGDSASAKNAFFAEKIVLVEGPSESIVLPVLFGLVDFNYEKKGIAIVKCGGKTELDRFYRLYVEFGIPCYVIFDGDKHLERNTACTREEKEKNIESNQYLQEILAHGSEGNPIAVKDYPSGIPQTLYLGFEDCLESALDFPIGQNKKKPTVLYDAVVSRFQDAHEAVPGWVKELAEKIQSLPNPPKSILKTLESQKIDK